MTLHASMPAALLAGHPAGGAAPGPGATGRQESVSRLRRDIRRLALGRRPGAVSRARLRLYWARWPLIAAFKAVRAVRKYGRDTWRVAGVLPGRQLWQQWKLAAAYRCQPSDYYLFKLFRPERAGLAPGYVYRDEAQVLLTHINQSADRATLGDKTTFAIACRQRGLPHANTVALFEGGRMVEPAGGGPADLPRADLFCKYTNLWCGIGAEGWRWDPAAGAYESLSDPGEWLDAAGLCARWSRGSSGPGGRPHIVQRRLKNHPRMAPFTAGALSTVRVVTAHPRGGEPQFVTAVLRMPVGRACVDNFAAGGVASPIDPATGLLGPAVSKALGPLPLLEHPDTRQRIAGREMPFWPEILSLALRAHREFPRAVSVGWDIAVCEDGPVLVEANADVWCTELVQAAHGRPLMETCFTEIALSHLGDGPADSRAENSGDRRGGSVS